MRYVESAEQEALDRVIGVLYLDSRERGALRSAHTSQAALETLSAEAAIAIENARLYREALDKAKIEQELKVAAGIQQSLLPPGNHSGEFFAAAAASVPCRSVGGDFFDYVDLPDGAVGFILGDVSGKGSPAALLAAAVLGMFSAEATYQDGAASPITRVNAGLFRRAIEARFLTAFYGILARTARLRYTNAGHNPPILLSAHRHPPPRGGRSRARPLRGRDVRPGDGPARAGRLLLVLQRRRDRGRATRPDEEFGDDRLIDCVASRHGTSRRSRCSRADLLATAKLLRRRTAERRHHDAGCVKSLRRLRRFGPQASAGSVSVTVVPTPRSLATRNRPAVQLDVALGDRQPQAGAGRLGREVGLEDPRERLLIHADARVATSTSDARSPLAVVDAHGDRQRVRLPASRAARSR